MNNGSIRISSSEINTFLSQLSYSAFYQRHIPNFPANGKTNVSCLCPFHEDKQNSFSVNIQTGLWFCFAGCGGGNPIQLLQKRYDLNFMNAVERIAAEEGIDNPFQKENGNQNFKKKKSSHLTSNQITALHQDLIQNATVLKKFQEKYGLTRETIEKYQIGYKQGKYVIPIEVSPGKWFIKLHKGYQTRGAKAVIYPAGILQDGLPYIIITEGEFKALLLNQLGFPAVSSTGGAGTWKQEWNTLFKGLIVILAYDNDEPGKKGAKRAASSLKGMAQSVKRIQWPAYMNSKDKKDITDFFVTLKKTKQNFQALLDSATEIGYDIKELDGLKFVEPDDYQIDEEGIKHLSMFKDNAIEKVISPAPVVITSRAIDIDLGNEEIEIAFRRDWKWKKLWVSRRTLCDSRKVIELSDQGVPVNSSNAKKMVEYLCSCETSNIPIIKRAYVTKGLGWKEINDKKIFLITKDKSQNTRDIDFTPEPGFERFVKALSPTGSFDKWKEAAKLAILFPFSNFAFYASFAAPLLHILKAPNFIIDFWGPTSVGKTSVLELAASVWGNPHKESGGLVFSWDSTRVFLERMANFFCDVPIFPDDSQTTDDRTLTKILYMVANGVGRGRGSTVGIRQTASWRTVCFSTGEKPLTECTTFAGAKARTIGVYGPPFGNMSVEIINTIKHQLRENYGHAGPMFVKELAKRINNKEWIKQLQRDYRQQQKEFSSMATIEIGDRVSHYFAVVDVAAHLVNEVLDIRHEKATEMITQVFLDYIKESDQETDMATRAMRYVLSWASGNERYFKGTDYESYGVWIDGEHIAIYPHKLAEVLKEAKLSEKAVLKEWANKGWIKRQVGHYTFPISIKLDSEVKRRRLVAITWETVERYLS